VSEIEARKFMNPGEPRSFFQKIRKPAFLVLLVLAVCVLGAAV
jgi:hypothetical protein